MANKLDTLKKATKGDTIKLIKFQPIGPQYFYK